MHIESPSDIGLRTLERRQLLKLDEVDLDGRPAPRWAALGGHRHMRGAPANHAKDRSKHAANRRDLASVLIPRRGQGAVVPKEFVGSIN